MRRRAQTLNSLLRHQVLSRYKAYLVILHVRIHNYSTVYLPIIYVKCGAQL